MFKISKYLWFAIILAWIMVNLSSCTNGSQRLNDREGTNVSLGMTYLQQGNRDKARRILNQALIENPHSPVSLDGMAYLEELSGNLDTANNYYLQAIKRAPLDGNGHNNYGAFLCRHGHPQPGIHEFLVAAQFSSYLFPAIAYENAGLCALKIPDQKIAKEYFLKALENDPQRKIAKQEVAVLSHP